MWTIDGSIDSRGVSRLVFQILSIMTRSETWKPPSCLWKSETQIKSPSVGRRPFRCARTERTSLRRISRDGKTRARKRELERRPVATLPPQAELLFRKGHLRTEPRVRRGAALRRERRRRRSAAPLDDRSLLTHTSASPDARESGTALPITSVSQTGLCVRVKKDRSRRWSGPRLWRSARRARRTRGMARTVATRPVKTRCGARSSRRGPRAWRIATAPPRRQTNSPPKDERESQTRPTRQFHRLLVLNGESGRETGASGRE